MPCRPPSTERCLVFCSPVLAASAFVSRGRLFEMAAAGAGEETDSAMVVMSLVGVTASRERRGWGCKLKADNVPKKIGVPVVVLYVVQLLLLLLMLFRKAAYCVLL